MLSRLFPIALAAPICFLPTSHAEACSPPLPGVVASMPEAGQSWPANAAVLFEGYSLYSDGFSATIDGSPAQVVLVEGLRGQTNGQSGGFGTEQVGFTLDPAPEPGQSVEVGWSECPSCEGFSLRYIAGPDEAAPIPEAPALRFDLAYYDNINIDGFTCFYFQGLAYAWHLDLEGQGGAPGYPQALQIIPRTLGGESALYQQTIFDDGEGASGVYYGDSTSVTDTPAAESICFDVRAMDVFGQVSDVKTSCMPCNIATPELPPPTDTGGEVPGYSSFPPEPEWALEGAPYCGGLCDTGPECEEEGDGGGEGGCSSAPASGVSLWALAFLGALGLRRARRIPG